MKLIREMFGLGQRGLVWNAKQGFRGRLVGKLAALLRGEMKIRDDEFPTFLILSALQLFPQELET